MAIPASHIVAIEPRVISAGSADLRISGLLLTRSPLVPVGKAFVTGSASGAAEFFGAGTPEAEAAASYFKSYDNKFTTPREMVFARWPEGAAAGWLRGAEYTGGLAALKAVASGALSLEIDGEAVSASGISLVGADSPSAAAGLIEAALDGDATVSYDTVTRAFTVTSATSGAGSGVGFAAQGELADLLNLTAQAGATVSPGSDALTPGGLFEAVRADYDNWVTFTTAWEASPGEMLALARWAGENYGFLYVAWTTDEGTLNRLSDTDPASLLKAAGHDHTAVIYGSLRHAAFMQGVAASIPWERVSGAVTFAFKSQSGLEATVSRKSWAEALEAKNCNYYGNYATRAAEFRFQYGGIMSASLYRFIDPYVNSVWLNNMLQRSIMDGLVAAGRVPYTPRGYGRIRAWMMDPVDRALVNGVIESGMSLSQSQKSELASEAGRDISAELSGYGYCLQILDPGAAARVDRESPIINLWYAYAGSVQRISVASTAVL